MLDYPTSELFICDLKDRTFKPTGPVAGSLGPHVLGICNPKPHLTDPFMQAASTAKRVGADLPLPNPALLKKFKHFIRKWIAENLDPLTENELYDFESWLKSRTDYTETQRENFRDMYQFLVEHYDFNNLEKRMTWIVQFTKDEFYEELKFNRGIYSRADWCKVVFGPLIHSVEKKVYNSRKEFIKKVPVEDRPDFIMRLFNAEDTVWASDYSSFESSFRRIIMEACEAQMYRHMVKGTSMESDMEYFIKTTTGVNIFESTKGVFGAICARRMSGEMTTSIGNGFTNLMMIYFQAELQGISWKDVAAVIEGDDSLFQHKDFKPTEQFYLDLGFSIKLDRHDNVNTASFCGLIFDPTDKVNLANPLKMISRFGWGPAKYTKSKPAVKKALIRAKALSFACQYPGCPIIYPFAKRFLDLTKDHDVRHLKHEDKWKQSVVDRALEKKVWQVDHVVPDNSRALMAKKFGISIECQLELEKQFLLIEDPLAPIDCPIFEALCPDEWASFYQTNVFTMRHDLMDCWEINNERQYDDLFKPISQIQKHRTLEAIYEKLRTGSLSIMI